MSSLSASRPSWRDTTLVLLLGALPALLAWATYGIIQQPDTIGYLAYAAEIRNGTVPTGQALLHAGAAPISLFRAPGYPAFLAGLQAIFLARWREAAVLLQIAASAVITAAVYRTALGLGVRRSLAVAAALLPAVGFTVVLQIALLTDALNAVFLVGAALSLVAWTGIGGAIVAGGLLAVATTFREATPFLAVAFLPLAWCCGEPRWRRMLATIALPWCAVAMLMGWNVARIGRPVLTTTTEVNMVLAVFPLIRAGLPVYSGNDAFDRTARETLTKPDSAQIPELLRHLFRRDDMTAPQLADIATARYARAWVRFPLAMLVSSARNFRTSFLNMPFAPVDTIADLESFSGRQPSPDIVKLNLLWHRTLAGDAISLFWLSLVVVTRTLGIAIAIIGAVCPWLPGRSWQVRGLWFICAGIPVIYMPVALDGRYLLPVVPLICLAAAASVPAAYTTPSRRNAAIASSE